MGLAESVESALGKPRGRDEPVTEALAAEARVEDAPSGLAASIEAALSTPTGKAPEKTIAKAGTGETGAGAVTGRTINRRAAPVAVAQGPVDVAAIPETAAHAVTGIGTSIVGGWRGMAELARGGSLEDAVQAEIGRAHV